MVQRRAARWVTGRYHNTSSVTDMLHRLDWRTLEQSRVDLRPCMLYKVQNNLVAIEEDKYLQRGTRRRPHQYRRIRENRNYTLYSLFLLSPDCHSMESTPQSDMLGRLDRYLQDQGCEGRALQPQFPTYLLSPCIMPFCHFFPLSFLTPTDLAHLFHFSLFPLSHSTGDNPQSWGRTSILAKAKIPEKIFTLWKSFSSPVRTYLLNGVISKE